MKLTENEKCTLKLLVKNPLRTNSDIAKELKLTAQGVSKIRKQLYEKGIIKGYELNLDYEKLDLNIHVIALIKIAPSAFKKFRKNELDNVLKSKYAVRSYEILETDVTHVVKYAFKDIKEYHIYFRSVLDKFGDYVEIKHSFVLSSEGMIKSSTMDLFLEALDVL